MIQKKRGGHINIPILFLKIAVNFYANLSPPDGFFFFFTNYLDIEGSLTLAFIC